MMIKLLVISYGVPAPAARAE
jgi:hypothetical protein